MLSTATKLRIARVLYFTLHNLRRLFGAKDDVRVRRRGVNWELDLREGIDLNIYLFGAFERETLSALESLVKDGAAVLDVGANIGAHTLHLSRLVGENGRVIAFEPTDFAVAKLRTNLRANPGLESRVDVRQVFLVGSEDGAMASTLASSWPVDGTKPDDAQMSSRSMDLSGAHATTVDAVVAGASDPEIQLIKMDVDGHELEVLEGAQSLLRRRRPVIVMELAPYVFKPPEKFDAMVNLLSRQGYSFRRLNSNATLPTDPSALRSIIPAEGSINVVAFPAPTSPVPGLGMGEERVAV